MNVALSVQIVSGTLYTFSGVTVTVTFATNQVQTSTDQSSQLSSNDIIVLTNQAGTDSREFTVDSVSGSTITTTEYVGMASAATYTLKKKIISIESALEDLDNIRNVTVTAFSDSDGTTSVTKACGSSGSHYIHITFTLCLHGSVLYCIAFVVVVYCICLVFVFASYCIVHL